MISNNQLLKLYKNAVVRSNEAQVAAQEYNLLLQQALKERLAPPGYSIDFLGDGKLKPEPQCKRTLEGAPVYDKSKSKAK